MEDTFDRAARIAELLAEAEAVDWTPEWMPQQAPGWVPGTGPAPAGSALAGSGAGMGVEVDVAAGADGDPDLDDTDPAVRRWRVGQVVDIRAQLSRLQAMEHRQLAALAKTAENAAGDGGRDTELAFRSLTAELAVACRVSTRTMAGRLSEATRLASDFPATLSALQEGRVESGHVRTIVRHAGCIEDADSRAQYEGTVLQRAALVAPGRLAKYAELTAARVGKVTFQQRHEKARDERCVRLSQDENGMSTLTMYVSTLIATAVWDRLTQQAKAVHDDAVSDGGDPRTFDQLRTDLAAELLLTGQPSGDPDAPHKAGVGIRAEVSVVIPAMSLLRRPAGAAVDPPVLAGGGPIGMDEARALAADAPELVRILTHPVTGMVLNVDTYRPSKRLRRFLQIRDGRCRFPVCCRAPRRCDIDHTVDWKYGGKTRDDNLECLCRSDHTLKHNSAWKVRQVAPGVLEWTSPLGQIITDLPDTDIPGSTAQFGGTAQFGSAAQFDSTAQPDTPPF